MKSFRIPMSSAWRVPIILRTLQRCAELGGCAIESGVLIFETHSGVLLTLYELHHLNAETDSARRALRAITRRIIDGALEAAL